MRLQDCRIAELQEVKEGKEVQEGSREESDVFLPAILPAIL
jgi:hypothetical protein